MHFMEHINENNLNANRIEDLVTFFELLDRIKVSEESMREN
jgi:hypothetical protein